MVSWPLSYLVVELIFMVWYNSIRYNRMGYPYCSILPKCLPKLSIVKYMYPHHKYQVENKLKIRYRVISDVKFQLWMIMFRKNRTCRYYIRLDYFFIGNPNLPLLHDDFCCGCGSLPLSTNDFLTVFQDARRMCWRHSTRLQECQIFQPRYRSGERTRHDVVRQIRSFPVCQRQISQVQTGIKPCTKYPCLEYFVGGISGMSERKLCV